MFAATVTVAGDGHLGGAHGSGKEERSCYEDSRRCFLLDWSLVPLLCASCKRQTFSLFFQESSGRTTAAAAVCGGRGEVTRR